MEELGVVGVYHKAYGARVWIAYKSCKICSNPKRNREDQASQILIRLGLRFCSVRGDLKEYGHAYGEECGGGDRKSRECKCGC